MHFTEIAPARSACGRSTAASIVRQRELCTNSVSALMV